MRLYTLKQALTIARLDAGDIGVLLALSGILIPATCKGMAARKGIEWHWQRLVSAQRHGLVEVLFDKYGREAARVVCVDLTPNAEKKLLAQGPSFVGAEDFAAEGGMRWILELSIEYGLVKEALSSFLNMDDERETYSYFRIKGGKPVFKRLRTESLENRLVAAFSNCDNEPEFLISKAAAGLLHTLQQHLENKQALGSILMLCRQSAKLRELPCSELLLRLAGGLQRKTYQLFLDNERQPIAYLAWAWLTAEALDKLCAQSILRADELGCGEILTIVEYISTREDIVEVSDFIRELYPSENIAILQFSKNSQPCRPIIVQPSRRAEVLQLISEDEQAKAC